MSTEVLIASAKTNRLYLSVKSVLPSKRCFLLIFLDMKKYTEAVLSANLEDRTKTHCKDSSHDITVLLNPVLKFHKT